MAAPKAAGTNQGKEKIVMRVMIVEDNRSEREYLAQIATGILATETLCCRTAEEALSALQEYTFDLFLLDVQLPGKSGFVLAEHIRSMPEYTLTPILFITGNERDCLSAFRTYHCYDYINKPVSGEELREKLISITTAVKNQAEEKAVEKVICLSSREGDVFIKKSELLFVEIQGGTCIFHMRDCTFEKKGISLAAVIDEFGDDTLVRCHKSFAVNTENIIAIKNINYRCRAAYFRDSDETVDISKKYYDTLLLKMKKS